MSIRARVAAVGDTIINRRVTSLRDHDFVALQQLICGADTAIANFEAVSPRSPLVPAPAAGLSVSSPHWVVDELRWLGFDLFNLANNHTTAFGWQGFVDTLEVFADRGLPVAGGGHTLTDARAPGYHDGPTARVGMVGVTCTNAEVVLAADPGRGVAGRPGASPLRFSLDYALDDERFGWLTEIDRSLGTAAARVQQDAFRGRAPAPAEEVIPFLGHTFVRADEPGIRGRLYEPDIAALESAIGEARRQADLVVVSIHCHEGDGGEWNGSAPPDFLIKAARRCIDAGADMIVGHGPHRLRGIEIYRGHPIFYSLGNFFLQIETVEPVPRAAFENEDMPSHGVAADYHDQGWIGADGSPIGFAADPVWFESVLAVCEFDGGQLDVRLYPVELGHALPRSQRGVPRLVDREQGEAILGRLAELSAPFGTELKIVDDGKRAVATWSSTTGEA